MTTDLRTALELLVGDGPSGFEEDELPWDLDELARSIRRARRMRSGVRGAVSVGAAASLGLAGMVVADSWGIGDNHPGPASGLGTGERGAADSSAPATSSVPQGHDGTPGTCRSSIYATERSSLLSGAQLLTVPEAGGVQAHSPGETSLTVMASPTPIAVLAPPSSEGVDVSTLRAALADSEGTIVALVPFTPVLDEAWLSASALTHQSLSTAMLSAGDCADSGDGPTPLLTAGTYTLALIATTTDGRRVRAADGNEWQVEVDPSLATIKLTASALRDSDGDGNADRADPVVPKDAQVHVNVGDTASTLLSTSSHDNLLMRLANGLSSDGEFGSGWDAMSAQFDGWAVLSDSADSDLTVAVKEFPPMATSDGGARRQVLVSMVTDADALSPLHLTPNTSLASLITSINSYSVTFNGSSTPLGESTAGDTDLSYSTDGTSDGDSSLSVIVEPGKSTMWSPAEGARLRVEVTDQRAKAEQLAQQAEADRQAAMADD